VSRSGGTVLLFTYWRRKRDRAPPTGPAKSDPEQGARAASGGGAGPELLPRAARRHTLGAVHQLGVRRREREVGYGHMLGPAVELAKFRTEARAYVADALLLYPFQMARAEYPMPISGSENQVENTALPACLSRYPAI